ncbi:hypothetical protein Pelo_4618 [Pelomyxa schiedti]|nr:hypothetical protein Pelo_4618 [Pelomyxa schiedti]
MTHGGASASGIGRGRGANLLLGGTIGRNQFNTTLGGGGGGGATMNMGATLGHGGGGLTGQRPPPNTTMRAHHPPVNNTPTPAADHALSSTTTALSALAGPESGAAAQQLGNARSAAAQGAMAQTSQRVRLRRQPPQQAVLQHQPQPQTQAPQVQMQQQSAEQQEQQTQPQAQQIKIEPQTQQETGQPNEVTQHIHLPQLPQQSANLEQSEQRGAEPLQEKTPEFPQDHKISAPLPVQVPKGEEGSVPEVVMEETLIPQEVTEPTRTVLAQPLKGPDVEMQSTQHTQQQEQRISVKQEPLEAPTPRRGFPGTQQVGPTPSRPFQQSARPLQMGPPAYLQHPYQQPPLNTTRQEALTGASDAKTLPTDSSPQQGDGDAQNGAKTIRPPHTAIEDIVAPTPSKVPRTPFSGNLPLANPLQRQLQPRSSQQIPTESQVLSQQLRLQQSNQAPPPEQQMHISQTPSRKSALIGGELTPRRLSLLQGVTPRDPAITPLVGLDPNPYETTIHELKEELARMKAEKNLNFENMVKCCEDLRNKNRISEEQRNKLKELHQTLQRENSSLLARLEELETKKNELLEQERDKLAGSHDEVSILQGQVSDLEAKLSKNEEQHEALTKENTELNKLCESTMQLSEQQRLSWEASESDNAKLRSEMDEVSKERESLREQLQQCQGYRTTADLKVQESSSKLQELDTLRRQLQEKEEFLNELKLGQEAENSRRETDMVALRHHLQETEESLKQSQNQLQAATQKISVLESRSEGDNELQLLLQETEIKLQETTNSLSNSEREVAEHLQKEKEIAGKLSQLESTHEDTIKQLTVKLMKVNEENRETTKRMEQEKQSVVEQLSTISEKAKSLEEECDALRREKEDLSISLKDVTEGKERISTDLNSIKEHNAVLSDQLLKKQQECSAFENEVQELKTENHKERVHMESLCAEMGSEKTRLEAELKASQERSKTLQEQLQEITISYEAAKRDVLDRECTVAALTQDAEALKVSHEVEMKTLQGSLSDLGSKNSLLQQELDRSADVLAKTSQEKTEYNDRAETLQQELRESTDLVQQRGELAKTREAHNASTVLISELQTQIEKERELFGRQEAELKKAREQVEITRQDSDQVLVQLQKEHTALQEKYRGLSEDHGNLEGRNKALQLACEETTRKIDMLQTQHTQLGLGFTELTSQYDILKKSLEEREQTISQLRMATETTEKRKANLQASHDELLANFKQLLQEVEDWKTKYNSSQQNSNQERDRYEAQKVSMQQQIEEIRNEYKTTTDQKQELAKVVEQLNLKLSGLEAQIQLAEKETSSLQSQCTELQKEVASLGSVRDALKEEMKNCETETLHTQQRMQEECTSLKVKLDQVQQECLAAKEKASSLEASISSINTAHQELEREVEQLRSVKAQLQESLESANKDNSSMREHMSDIDEKAKRNDEELQKIKEEKEGECQRLRDKCAKFEEEKQELVAEKNGECDRLRNKFAKLEKECVDLDSKCTKLTAEIAVLNDFKLRVAEIAVLNDFKLRVGELECDNEKFQKALEEANLGKQQLRVLVTELEEKLTQERIESGEQIAELLLHIRVYEPPPLPEVGSIDSDKSATELLEKAKAKIGWHTGRESAATRIEEILLGNLVPEESSALPTHSTPQSSPAITAPVALQEPTSIKEALPSTQVDQKAVVQQIVEAKATEISAVKQAEPSETPSVSALTSTTTITSSPTKKKRDSTKETPQKNCPQKRKRGSGGDTPTPSTTPETGKPKRVPLANTQTNTTQMVQPTIPKKPKILTSPPAKANPVNKKRPKRKQQKPPLSTRSS